MKLLTHNMLTSNIIKGVSKGYPLKIMADKVEVKDVDFNPEFVSRMIPKLDWSALCSAASEHVTPSLSSGYRELSEGAIAVRSLIVAMCTHKLIKRPSEVGHSENLPADLGESYETDQEFLKRAHHVLMQVEVIEGNLVCPESGRKFPISNGIPNMLLNEDEV